MKSVINSIVFLLLYSSILIAQDSTVISFTKVTTIDSAGAFYIVQGGADRHVVWDQMYDAIIDSLETGLVSTAMIQAAAVEEAEIAFGAVTENKIGTGAVTENKIGTGAVTENKIGTGAVTENKLGSISVTTGKIANGAVTSIQLGDTSVSTAKIKDLAVTNNKLGSNSVTGAKIDDLAITTGKIQDGAVTSAKLADSLTNSFVFTGNLKNYGQVTYVPEEVGFTGTNTYSAANKVIHSLYLGAGAATLTDFTAGESGQVIILQNALTSNYNLTIYNSRASDDSNIFLKSTSRATLEPGESLLLFRLGTVWYEIGY